MRFQLKDLYGDTISVAPVPSRGIVPKVNIQFRDEEAEVKVEMLLDDRLWQNLKQAGNRSIKESERMG